jgi:hypothetical protein
MVCSCATALDATTHTWQVLVAMARNTPSCQFVICIKHKHVDTKVEAFSSVITAALIYASTPTLTVEQSTEGRTCLLLYCR